MSSGSQPNPARRRVRIPRAAPRDGGEPLRPRTFIGAGCAALLLAPALAFSQVAAGSFIAVDTPQPAWQRERRRDDADGHGRAATRDVQLRRATQAALRRVHERPDAVVHAGVPMAYTRSGSRLVGHVHVHDGRRRTSSCARSTTRRRTRRCAAPSGVVAPTPTPTRDAGPDAAAGREPDADADADAGHVQPQTRSRHARLRPARHARARAGRGAAGRVTARGDADARRRVRVGRVGRTCAAPGRPSRSRCR